MNIYSSIGKFAGITLITGAILFSSCRTKDKINSITPEIKNYGSLTVKVSNEAGGQPITFGTMSFTNAAGNKYSVDLLKYFVSNFTLIRNDGSERNFGNYKLIDASDTSTCSFTLDSVSNGSYKAIRFYLGVDSLHNHTVLNQGDLNPISGMVWSWNTGYIFFKHEGSYINDTGTSKILLYHFGTDAALSTVDIPITQFDINSNKKTLYIKFDLNSLYNAPNTINFTGNNFHQSTELSDRIWLGNLRTNFSSSFTFDKVQ